MLNSLGPVFPRCLLTCILDVAMHIRLLHAVLTTVRLPADKTALPQAFPRLSYVCILSLSCCITGRPQHMLAGAAAGVTEHTAMYPVDTIKTRMQALSHPGQRVRQLGLSCKCFLQVLSCKCSPASI
jgi:hypothetical protein